MGDRTDPHAESTDDTPDAESTGSQPGLDKVRAAVASAPRPERPSRRVLRADAIAGLINAVVSVPSSMATAAMAGVNPIYGLYAITVAPGTGSLLASTQLMQIATTGASALAAGQAISSYSSEEHPQALFLLVLLTGGFLALFGLLKAGTLLRYISYPVMTAFLSGVAIVLVFDQTAQLVGYEPSGANSLDEFIDLLRNLDQISPQSTLVGVVALAIMAFLSRTRFSNVSALIALIVGTAIVAVWNPDGVQIVSDISEIPRGLPPLGMPDLGLISTNLFLSAFAVAAVIAVQGAGVSQSVVNPDGSVSDPSRDMIAQGAANLAGSLVSGMPTGGSISNTALTVSAGGRSRLTGIFHSLSMLVIILLVPWLVSMVPMPVLAAIMIVAGFSAIKFDAMRSIWNTSATSKWALGVTLGATLVTSVSIAVGLGVAVAVVLYVTSASSLTLWALERREGEIHVVDPPEKLPSRRVTVLEAYGSLFFAAARTLQDKLPDAQGAERAVVVLRLRGNDEIGSTLIDVLNDYAGQLAETGGRLYLSGMDEVANRRLERAEKLDLDDQVQIFPATGILGASTRNAIAAATAWLQEQGANPPAEDEGPLWVD